MAPVNVPELQTSPVPGTMPELYSRKRKILFTCPAHSYLPAARTFTAGSKWFSISDHCVKTGITITHSFLLLSCHAPIPQSAQPIKATLYQASFSFSVVTHDAKHPHNCFPKSARGKIQHISSHMSNNE